MSHMRNPPHPGEVIKELCLDPLELTVTAAAEGLGVSRRNFAGHGYSSIKGIWPFAGELVAAPATI